jgi:hypothetical protein
LEKLEASLANEENDDNALTRFEWLEIMIRITFAKFIDSMQIGDPSLAYATLMRETHDTLKEVQ